MKLIPSPKIRSFFWRQKKLCFFRDKIDSLQMHESFTAACAEGEFTMTKAQFFEDFENVLLSSSYQDEGVFTYPEIPAKAWKYLSAQAA